MYTTLNKIRSHLPCGKGWKTLLKSLGKTEADDEPLPLLQILESNGLFDALWCLKAVPGFEREKRLLAVAFVEEVVHLITDPRSLSAIDVARRYANGQATEQELHNAYDQAVFACSERGSCNTWIDINAERQVRGALRAALSTARTDASVAAFNSASHSLSTTSTTLDRQALIFRTMLEPLTTE